MIATYLAALPRSTKKAVLLASDTLCLPVALMVASLFHLGEFPIALLSQWQIALLAPAVAIPIFVSIGLYRAVVRYISSQVVYTAFKGMSFAAIALAIVTQLGNIEWINGFTLGIYWALGMIYITGSRFAARNFMHHSQRPGSVRQNVAIYGAGSAGAQLAMALRAGRDFRPVAFIDDKKELRRTTVRGIKVYPPSSINELTQHHGVSQVFLALPSADSARRRSILSELEKHPVRIRTIAPLVDILSGQASIDEIRDIDISDLLGRESVPPVSALMGQCIESCTVMVTGAGGSIGSELCRQILVQKPKKLVLFEKSEFALYQIDQELNSIISLHSIASEVEIIPILGSITDQPRLLDVMTSLGVQTIYHAAAYKHVPLVEQNPVEGVRNNVFGTLAIARAAIESGVKNFVLISTDKAVRPTNVMGATKRSAELILQALADLGSHSTTFCMVRFGNVLASSGSVVPLFRRQIRAGGPVTVTHAEITRYFMTIPEAAQLVIQAGSMAQGGDVFILDMGEPIKIVDLARRMIRLSGFEVKEEAHPGGDIQIKYTGLRPGEKLYEELLVGTDSLPTVHSRILRARESKLPWGELELLLGELEGACTRMNADEIRRVLQKIVIEYGPVCDIVDAVWNQRDGMARVLKTEQAANDEQRNEPRIEMPHASTMTGTSAVEAC